MKAQVVCQPGFFDPGDRYAELSAAGDPLERLSSVVDFELFRGPLTAALRRGPRRKGGRPPFPSVQCRRLAERSDALQRRDER